MRTLDRTRNDAQERIDDILDRALAGERLTPEDGYRLIHADATQLTSMMAAIAWSSSLE